MQSNTLSFSGGLIEAHNEHIKRLGTVLSLLWHHHVFMQTEFLSASKCGLRPPRGLCEANLQPSYKPCVTGAIPSQTYGDGKGCSP